MANGAILPRASGDLDTPLTSAVKFVAPPSLEVSFEVPSGRIITGMGISAGITLLVGGGFHGKSTLLRALERGVYAHVPGDGREFVVCDSTAISIRAEDGRAVTGTDISAMIRDLPGGVDTRNFSTTNASGSTSQAVNLAEALEVGAKTLLIDEDTSATNFMIRDERMKALISAEPITPFVDRVKALWEQLGVSTVLVMGGSGAFLEQANTVILMENFLPSDVTEKAHQIAAEFAEKTAKSASPPANRSHAELAGLGSERFIRSSSLLPDDARKPPRARGLEQIQIGKEDLDLRYLSQLVDPSQTQAIALCLGKVADFTQREGSNLAQAVHAVVAQIEAEGLDKLTGGGSRSRGDLAAPRAAELHQAISRWRKLRVK
ncbi:P-loop domain-containing protein [uncultured Rothia sp.]|uniref:P-loop domain-containing protein n=1 Tax=uncultured Rothia sp. TaxID=316088 RepID=UPI003217D924